MWQTYNLLMSLQETFPDGLEKAETIVECSLINFHMGDLQKAIELLKRAERLYEKNRHHQAVVRWMIGAIQWALPEERVHAYESWNQCLHEFDLLQSCSVDQAQAGWYAERVKEIQAGFDQEINQEQEAGEPAPATAAASPDQPASPGPSEPPSQDETPGQPDSAEPLYPMILQLFSVIEQIPAGGFGPVGYRPLSIGEVDIDRVIIRDGRYRMVNLRGSGKSLSLPPSKYVVVKITGDSMNRPGKLGGEGIDLGDYVLLRIQDDADDGDIVAAEIDNEDSYATLKRFHVDQPGLKYILEPQSTNPAHQPREFSRLNEGFHIRGVALIAFKPID